MPDILTLHGGCFVGGSASWDKPQTEMLQKMGFTVHQLKFPKDNLQESINFILDYIYDKFEQPESDDSYEPYYILGKSSDGLLAKYIFDNYKARLPNLKHVIYIAPVLNPKLRAILNPKFKYKQAWYFRYTLDNDTLTEEFNPKKEMLLLATHDENVPTECFTQEQIDNAVYLGIATHKELTCTTSYAFQQLINDKVLNS